MPAEGKGTQESCLCLFVEVRDTCPPEEEAPHAWGETGIKGRACQVHGVGGPGVLVHENRYVETVLTGTDEDESRVTDSELSSP